MLSLRGLNHFIVITHDLIPQESINAEFLLHWTGSGLRLDLQFSDSKLLFDFVLSFDMRQVTQTWYSRRHEQKTCETKMKQKLDCTVDIEFAGRSFGKKITEADIRRSVASVVPGHQLFPRVCASVNKLILSMKD